MNNMKVDPVKRVVWSHIARELAKEKDVESCLCYGDEFYSYLDQDGGLPFILEQVAENNSPWNEDGSCDLIVGWQVPAEDSSTITPDLIFRSLKDRGEALLYGYYRDPRPEDILEWERRCLQEGIRVTIQAPLSGSISMSRISGWLKEGPFDRFTIRKKGIYYQAWLRKGCMGSGE
jgi:hypothetical protein